MCVIMWAILSNLLLTNIWFVIIIKHARADVAELADALDLGSSGRPWEFKSLHPHQKKEVLIFQYFLFFGAAAQPSPGARLLWKRLLAKNVRSAHFLNAKT